MDDLEDDWAEPTSEASNECWSARLMFWRPSELSDERMRIFFHRYDGRWGRQTTAAMARFQAAGLDLNEGWALTPENWSCPACGRAKDAIFRLSTRRILLANLEVHHDHLRDAIGKRVDAALGADWRSSAPPECLRAIDQIKDVVIRFSSALVCSECNAADGAAKLELAREIDLRFTFTASEIGAFIKPNPNAPHKLDIEKARAMWRAQEPGFRYRLDLLDQLLEGVRAGLLTRCTLGLGDANAVERAMSSAELLQQAFGDEAKDSDRAGLLYGCWREFLSRSTSKDSERLIVPKRTARRVRAPTDAEYAVYQPPSPKRWNETPETWQCPICSRSKRETVRWSKSGQWSGNVRDFQVIVDEDDPTAIRFRRRLFPGYSNARMVARRETILVCSDCADVATRVRSRDRSLPEATFFAHDVRAIVTSASPHDVHEIDFEAAAARAIANAAYGSALQAHSSFVVKAMEIAMRFADDSHRGLKEEEIFDRLFKHVGLFHDVEDIAECQELTEWLLDEGRRLHRESRRPSPDPA